MNLSAEEISMVEKFRAEKKRRAEAAEYVLKIVDTASAFEKWRQEKKTGFSFSTFVDEFGYDHEDCKRIWQEVHDLLKAIHRRYG